jgi:two-component system heavy metal sensor histidine kinase CusS
MMPITFKTNSMALRLNAPYLAVCSLVFLASAFIIYSGFRSALYRYELRVLDLRAERFLQEESEQDVDLDGLFRILSTQPAGVFAQDYFLWVRISDGAGRTLRESPGMDQAYPAGLFQHGDVGDPELATRRLDLPGGKLVLLRSVRSKAAGRTHREFQVAVDFCRDAGLLAYCRGILAFTFAAGLILIVGNSLLIARRGLQPLEELGRTLGDADATRLDIPLRADQWPVETRQVIDGFNELKSRLHQTFQRELQFTVDLGHELRSPLQNLRLQAEVLLARPRKASEYRRALLHAQGEYLRLSKLTESLLLCARVENGAHELVLESVNVRGLMLWGRRQFRVQSAEKGISMRVEGGATARTDRVFLGMILENLIANAFAHTPRSGRITLRAEQLPAGAARITVADTGEGIDPKSLPFVFDRFFRGKASKTGTGGMGLGLSIVKAAVQRLRGSVTIASQPNLGTRVTVELP